MIVEPISPLSADPLLGLRNYYAGQRRRHSLQEPSAGEPREADTIRLSRAARRLLEQEERLRQLQQEENAA